MKRIDVKLNLPVVAPLLDVLRRAAETLANTLAMPLHMEDIDPEFRESWTEELVGQQRGEVGALLGLFDDEFLSTGVIRIDESVAEGVLRACSAFRLFLRANDLRSVSDEALEAGQVTPDHVPEALRPTLTAYIFLASLQELLLEHFEGA